MNKKTMIALSLSALLTGCGVLPSDAKFNNNFNNAATVNLETYEKFREETIKPNFNGKFDSCYQGELIESSDNYRVFVFNTDVLNTKFINTKSKVTSTEKFELGLYRDNEVNSDLLFEDKNGNIFEIENTELSSHITSVVRTSYLSGYDNSKTEENPYKVNQVDSGIDFLIAESKPGNFTYSFKKSKLLGFTEVNLVDDMQILTPIKDSNTLFVSTNKTHSHTVVNKKVANDFGEFGTKIKSTYTDVYICKSDKDSSPVKVVAK